jgi:hypothetical protein
MSKFFISHDHRLIPFNPEHVMRTEISADLTFDFEVKDEELESLEVTDVEQDGDEVTLTVKTGNITASKLENEYSCTVYDLNGTEFSVSSFEVSEFHESITVRLDDEVMQIPDKDEIHIEYEDGTKFNILEFTARSIGQNLSIKIEKPSQSDDLVSKQEIREQLIRQFAVSLDALLADGDSPQPSNTTTSETEEK